MLTRADLQRIGIWETGQAVYAAVARGALPRPASPGQWDERLVSTYVESDTLTYMRHVSWLTLHPNDRIADAAHELMDRLREAGY